MENDGNEHLPQFPAPPDGIARMEHLPTVEASIRYWDAVRLHAIRVHEPALELTAMALRDSYEQARRELTDGEQPHKGNAPLRARRGRLPRNPSEDGRTKI